MVKIKETAVLSSDGNIDLERWLQHVSQKGYQHDIALIRHACTLSQLAGSYHATETGESCLQQGLAMADVLADLEVDHETLAAAILFESVHFAELSLDDISEQLGTNIAHLIKGVEKMSVIANFQVLNNYPQNKHQIDNVRKMLLAMVDDVRVVLIKLAERLCVLRSSVPMSHALRNQIATEAMEIYAPLANRLGIGAIKWEMEDLAFRFLHPDEYKAIAKGLKAKRLDRDRYVSLIVDKLKQQLSENNILNCSVNGRSKHIHSIYRKMIRKNILLNEIYDATAVRIMVESHEQCYQVLDLVHSLWVPIASEFDDYIAKPKRNGYQSLHTAVWGPEDRIFEVQIRTKAMHLQAEMGVAAHWKYKEGDLQPKKGHERKIEWLREVLAWHREVTLQTRQIETEFIDDRVYVFTPNGDVLDLPSHSTTLDFAYHLHSDIGHRCRGAKVNGSIVPLTYCLKTGDNIEILTAKESKPSRDWLNPHLNYLRTSRAKAKVLHWFKMQHFDKHKADGQDLLDKELNALGLNLNRVESLVSAFNMKRWDDVLAALGRGDIKINQIINRISPVESIDKQTLSFKPSIHAIERNHTDLRVEGVGRLLTHMARCCQPLPGEDVIGYITLGRGVSVHRKDCSNVIHASDKQQERFLEVHWGNRSRTHYGVEVVIKAFDRPNLLRDITVILSNETIHVCSLNTTTDRQTNLTHIKLNLEIDGLTTLSRLLAKIKQTANVLEARRQIRGVESDKMAVKGAD